MIARAGCAVLLLILAACAARQPQPSPPPVVAPGGAPSTVTELAAAIDADSKRSDRETDSKVRSELADDASRKADDCLTQAPEAAACLYGRAVALGLMARAHPTRAGDLLKQMLDALTRAESADAGYDEAGPARVRALVLVRAPGWPLGPGDPEAGLAAARRAVSLRPQYPPNLLGLAEAQAKTGDAAGAQDSYARARDAASSLPAGGDRDDWLREANRGLKP